MTGKPFSSGISRRDILKIGGTVIGAASIGNVSAFGNLADKHKDITNIFQDINSKVDFSYAFGAPHRITAGRPDASDRTLVDVKPGSLKLSWSYDNLTMANYPPLAFRTPPTLWNIQVTPEIDSKPFANSRWTRLDGVLPGLENNYEDHKGLIKFEVLGGISAALVQISISNHDSSAHQYTIRCDSGNWGENPAWIDPKYNVGDHLVAGWNDRADRVLILGLGADSYSLQTDGMPTGPKKMIMVWNLKPGEQRNGWIIRPYLGYSDDLKVLRRNDWSHEMDQCKTEWHILLNRGSKLTIPDEGVTNAYRASLADLFIMRELLSDGHIIGVPGTEVYRAGNSGEPLIVAVALDQNGFHNESAAEAAVSIEMQDSDGCWADKKGWCHTFWAAAGFKAWAVMEHFRLTKDNDFLAKIYPRLVASARWQERQRARTRIVSDPRSLTYGLMPRGFGDCGLMNDEDNYGVFYPHNIWAVYADRCALEAAAILGKSEDIAELKNIYENGYGDLMNSLDKGAIKESDYRWIPGVPGKTTGSSWGALNILSPCGLLPADHELVTGTLRKIEANISKGGQPIHTGWMTDGAWVAITLDNVAEAHLARGNGDAAVKYLYSTLNHGTPLYTWCEERGQEPGTTKCSGDRQHLWTPVAVVRAIRDMLVMENGKGLNLAPGTDREWLGSGNHVGIEGACTHFGKLNYRMSFDSTNLRVTGEITLENNFSAKWIALHIRLPEGLALKTVDQPSNAIISDDFGSLRWKSPQGKLIFSATVGK